MRVLRLSVVALLAAAVLVFGFAGTASAATSPHTYKVLVGAENAKRGIDLMAFFPFKVKIHVGDTVHWVQNSNEIHTVTFLGGQKAPDIVSPAAALGLPEPPTAPSPLVFTPKAVTPEPAPGGKLDNRTTFVNSGLMSLEQGPGQATSFDVTFTAKGTYRYLCLVHGKMMSGIVKVFGPGVPVASPRQVKAQAHRQLDRKMAKVPAVLRAARSHIKAPVQNADGSMTRFVMLGYSRGQIDLMRFFPRTLNVQPGDKIVWQMTAHSDAPHTVTFLNDTLEPPLVTPFQGIPYISAGVFFPSPDPPANLTRMAVFSSGLLTPVPGTTYEVVLDSSVTTGPLSYECLLHDSSGMTGTLEVVAK